MENKKSSEVIYRFLQPGDVESAWVCINRLIAEDANLVQALPIPLEEEAIWVDKTLKGIAAKSTICIVAEANGKIIATSTLERASNPTTFPRLGHVGNFGIAISDPEFRARGVGYALASRVFEEAKKIGIKLVLLDYFEGNEAAHHLYLKLGFKECGRTPKKICYKGKYIDTIEMWKEI